MKIHFDNVRFGTRTGPNAFAERLARQFLIEGHTITLDDGLNSDVSLVFIERTGAPIAKKVVQRLDGIWAKPEEIETRNSSIKSLYDEASAVIFQSNFDRQFITKQWGYPKKFATIRNGIEPASIDKISPELIQLRQRYETVFVCSANWHRSKRLKENIELFIHLKKFHPNSCLIVMGNSPDHVVGRPDIYYTGSLPHEICTEVFAISDWMIHLAWFEHCPNTVVEALGQDVPVICTNVGGTQELVLDKGVIIPDVPYDFEPTNYDEPPALPAFEFQESLPERNNLGSSADIHISSTAKEYIRLFQSIS